MTNKALVWFRRDLRTTDHPALFSAAEAAESIFALYILDDNPFNERNMGAASRWWLHHSLTALYADLKALNIPLVYRRGDATSVVPAVAAEASVDAVYFSKIYEPQEFRLEYAVAKGLADIGRKVHCHEGSLIHPPGSVTNKEGRPYRVFTPFWKSWNDTPVVKPLGKIAPRGAAPITNISGERLKDFKLLPTHPDWSGGLQKAWRPGELGAETQLTHSIKGIVRSYNHSRDVPAVTGTSRLSAHLHFGEISPARVLHIVRTSLEASRDVEMESNMTGFLRQLCWREFNHDLLSRYPDMACQNINANFNEFPWQANAEHLAKWQRGSTGYPIVDAGMRELWATGWMHNRVRMIVASFLTKHLLINWQAGEDWFWDTLVDADLANNAANWQWVAGSGMDAAPYFRIFNPTLQGQRFDPAGDYVRKWVPERANYPAKQIHIPDPPAESLFADGYPGAIIEHKFARQRALDAYGVIKRRN